MEDYHWDVTVGMADHETVDDHSVGSPSEGSKENEKLSQEYGNSDVESGHHQHDEVQYSRQPPAYLDIRGYGQQTHPPQPQIITSNIPTAQVTPGTVLVKEEKRPPDMLWMALCVCLCCFWPSCIIAVIYASMAGTETDNKKAWAKYRMARNYIYISVVAGVVCIILVVIFQMAVRE